MDKQNKEITPTKSVEQKSHSSYSKKNWKKLVPIYIAIAIVLYGGIYFFLMQKNTLNYSKQSITPTPKANLNPNTGNLYKDIDSRLKEVIK